MIHLYVLFLFTAVLVSVLIGYSQFVYAFWVSICLSILILFRLFFKTKRPIITASIFLFSGAMLYFFIQNKINYQASIYQDGFKYQNTSDVFEGIISEFPRYRYSNNQYIVLFTKSKTQSGVTDLSKESTKVLMYTQPFQKLSYLDSISFKGSLVDVREEELMWHKYYQKLGVQYISWYPQIIDTYHINPSTYIEYILYQLFIFKSHIREKSIERFSSHTSALLLGMLLGEKDELSKEEKELFNRANLSHILVVSGYNISLVISFIFLLLKSFHRYVRTGFALVFVLLFVLLVGGDASVARSALMGSIVIVAQLFNRKSSSVHTLFLVALCMLLYNPNSIFDAGFHLSFLATYALLILPKVKKIPEYSMTTIWVFLYISIYSIYLSGSISFIGILTNILVLVCIPFFMFLSFMSLSLSFIPVTFGIDIFILEIMSRYIFGIASLAQFAPRLELQISPSITIGVYLVLLSVLGFINNRYTTSEFIKKRYQKFVPQKPN